MLVSVALAVLLLTPMVSGTATSARNLQGFPVVSQLTVTGEPVAMAITPSSDSLYVVSRGGEGYLSVFNLVTLELRYVVPLGSHVPFGVVSPPSSEGAYISMRDASTGAPKVALVPRGAQQVAAITDAPNAGTMAVGPFGRRIFIADASGSISAFITSTLDFVGSQSLGEPIGGMLLSTDETEIFVTLPSSNRISVLDSATFSTKRSVSVKNRPLRLAAAPDRSFIAVSHEGSPRLTLVDYSRLRQIKELRLQGQSTAVIHSTANNAYFLAVTAGSNSSLSAIARSTSSVVGRNSVAPSSTAIATDPWARRAFLADASSSSVTVFDLAPPAPGTPAGLQAVGIDKGVTVSWSDVPDPGSGVATRFAARVLKTKKACTTSGTSCTFRGLTPGKTYLISVQGSNIRGDGPAATVSITIPRKPPPPAPVPPTTPTEPPKPEQEVS